MTRYCILLTSTAVLLDLLGCNRAPPVNSPNRVLDRPADVGLACIERTGTGDDAHVEVLPLALCNSPTTGGCPNDLQGSGEPQLIGFVANSERNEVAMFRRCLVSAKAASLVDFDAAAPGFNLVPVGDFPSSLIVTDDSCRAVTANFGSCDLSVLDVVTLGGYALGLEPRNIEPSSAVSIVRPAVAIPGQSELGIVPLGSRPGQLLAVPQELSHAVGYDDPGGPSGGTDASPIGQEATSGGDSSQIDDLPPESGPVGSRCPEWLPSSVYVSFPSCHMVAEVDMLRGTILQSRTFERHPVTGEISLRDSGTDPQCPVDCPDQLEGRPIPAIEHDLRGVAPYAMTLVTPSSDPDADEAEQQIVSSSLFVGGLGAEVLFELPLDQDGNFPVNDEVRQLALDGSRGVQGIRVTPAMELAVGGAGAQFYQFIYVIAADGSTRVVNRDLGGGALGVECDTQVDARSVITPVCHEVGGDPGGVALDRHPLARGPGIRVPGSATITDWAFQKVDEAQYLEGTPFGQPGVVGVGVTSFGRVVFSVFGQFPGDANDETKDPVGLMDLGIRPHMLWPSVNPFSGETSVLPRVADETPRRLLPEQGEPSWLLAPALRHIDYAYAPNEAADDGGNADQKVIELAYGVQNVDHLGANDVGDEANTAVYTNSVARILARDYRHWTSQEVTLVWEGDLPGAGGATGQIVCQQPGWEGGTCITKEAGDMKLVDTSATFCDDGVLAGDKAFIFGCSDDDDCGAGQTCLKAEFAASDTTGICVSRTQYQTNRALLQKVCEPFIADPCGDPIREYLITYAAQDQLWLQVLDVQATSFVRERVSEDEPEQESSGQNPCGASAVVPVPAQEVPFDDDIFTPAPIEECEQKLVCAREQVDGGCESDRECVDLAVANAAEDASQWRCIAQRCRHPCEGADCTLRPLPGPACFAEFVTYQVRARNAFMVLSSGEPSFYKDDVRPDPNTGECMLDASTSALLTSRIRLGFDEQDTRTQHYWGLPECPSGSLAPNDPNPCIIADARPEVAQHPAALFHYFSYRTQPVTAIRMSNPVMTFVLDLTSLLDLAGEVPGYEQRRWPLAFGSFRRSRIPRGYRQSFQIQTGYIPRNDGLSIERIPLVYPVRIVNAPEPAAFYVVDAGGRGGLQGVRGQVMRIVPREDGLLAADEAFRVR